MEFELERSFEKDVQSLNDESRKKTEPTRICENADATGGDARRESVAETFAVALQSDPPKSPIQKIRMTADAAARAWRRADCLCRAGRTRKSWN